MLNPTATICSPSCDCCKWSKIASESENSARALVNTILDAYRGGDDPGVRLAIPSTYLGHINPVHTYWYLSASPELLKLAGDRLERHLGGDA